MPQFRVRSGGEPLLSAPPSEHGSVPLRLVTDENRIEKIEERHDGWSHVRLVGVPEPDKGFIRTNALIELAAGDKGQIESNGTKVDENLFFRQVMTSCTIHGVSPFYLLAIAFKESGLRNVRHGSSIGVLQFRQPTWDEICENNPALGVRPEDITNPDKQAIIGAVHTADLITTYEPVLGRPPEGRELYLGHLLGRSGGRAVLTARTGTDVLKALAEVVGQERARAMIQANATLLLKDNRPLSREEVLDAVETWLREGYVKAAELFRKNYPDEAKAAETSAAGTQAVAQSGDPPWLTKALSEVGTEEDLRPGHSNPGVEKYFAATTMRHADDTTDWCAAFVSWCVANCGDPIVVNTNIQSAKASDWLQWGKRIRDPARGALVVLHPVNTRNSGHVGFYVGMTESGHIRVLGGNQRDQNGVPSVRVSNFPIERFREYRWVKTSA